MQLEQQPDGLTPAPRRSDESLGLTMIQGDRMRRPIDLRRTLMVSAFAGSVLVRLAGSSRAWALLTIPVPSSARARPDLGLAMGLVHQVADGDSFSLTLPDGRRIAVRILGIDAPEHGQEFAEASRQFLRNLIEGRWVDINTVKVDPYGRAVAKVSIEGRDVGLMLLQAGLAWHFKRYESDQTRDDRESYARAEQDARRHSFGLWSDARPTPPWDFRDQQRHRPAS